MAKMRDAFVNAYERLSRVICRNKSWKMNRLPDGLKKCLHDEKKGSRRQDKPQQRINIFTLNSADKT